MLDPSISFIISCVIACSSGLIAFIIVPETRLQSSKRQAIPDQSPTIPMTTKAKIKYALN